MPELPEVQTVVNTLAPRVVGATFRDVHIARPEYIEPPGTDLRSKLIGRSVRQLHRRAKRIIFTLDSGDRFIVHLGMTGRLTLESDAAPRRLHTHVVFSLKDATGKAFEVHATDPRRFGQVLWLGDLPAEEGLGPEPLTLRPARLATILGASRRPIKSLLLDQTRIAGLGNIYVDEALFAAGIHPLTPANAVAPDQVRRLCRGMKSVLRKALRHRGSTLRDYVDAAGGKGSFQKLHNAYDREGEPCRICGTPMERIVLGGRSTCFCPKCQKK